MSDPTYNRRQGAQKYWALFQREQRKILEQTFRAEACQVPAFDYDRPLYPQLLDYQYREDHKYAPACAVYAEMLGVVEDLFLRCDVVLSGSALTKTRFGGLSVEQTHDYLVSKKDQDFREFFRLGDTGLVKSLITQSKNIKYMDKVRLRNIFPTQLTESVFEQWGLSDRFPKPDCSLLATPHDSPWCDFAVFKLYYDNVLTLLEYVDTICKKECAAVEAATSVQLAAFKNYFSIKRKYSEIMRQIREAVKYRTAEGSEELKSISSWAKEFGFGVDASYELLYKVTSTDKDNFADACAPGKDCVSRETVRVELATTFNPQSVSLTELERFVGSHLRSSIEGVAARSLASAERVTAAHKTLAGLTTTAFAECRTEFVSFINLWKTNYCNFNSAVIPATIGIPDLENDPIFKKLRVHEADHHKTLMNVRQHVDANLEKSRREKGEIVAETPQQRVLPLRRIWTTYRQNLLEIEKAKEDAERLEREEREEKDRLIKEGAAQERLASLIVDDMVKRQDEQEREYAMQDALRLEAEEQARVVAAQAQWKTPRQSAQRHASIRGEYNNLTSVDSEDEDALSDHGF